MPFSVRKVFASVWTLPIVTLLMVGGSLSWFAYVERNQAIDREFRSLESSARIAEAEVAGLVRNLEQLLNGVADDQKTLTPAQRAGFDRVLAMRMKQFPEIRSLVVINAAGRVELTATPKLKGFDSSKRDYFQAHLAGPLTPNLYVSRPFKTATGGDISIAFSVAMRDAAGKLRGMVVAGLDPRYFEAVLTHVRPEGEGTNATLFNTHGDLLYRIPDPERYAAASIAKATPVLEHLRSGRILTRHIGVSATDGRKRVFVLARVGQTGISVSLGRPFDDVLADWYRNLMLRAFIFFLAVALVISLSWQVYRRQLERNREADFSAGLIDSLPGVFYVLDTAGRLVRWNANMESATGWSGAELAGKPALELIGPGDREAVRERIENVFARGDTAIEAALLSRDGRETPYFFTGHRTLLDGSSYLVGVGTDIAARREAEKALRLAASIFQVSNEAIVVTDNQPHIVAVNPAFTQLTGYEEAEVLGCNPRMLSSGHNAPEIYRDMWESLTHGDGWQGELWDRRKSGEVYPKWMTISVLRDAAGRVLNYIGTFIDITERKASEERVRFLAHHDALTELPNRFYLIEQLGQSIGYCKRNDEKLALMLIDLDRFKEVNDTLGHPVGDRLLVQVAERLRHAVRDSDIIARLGGDEFVAALSGIESPGIAAAVATKIVQALSVPYRIDGSELRTSPSIGICIYPDDATDASELLKKADVAMYDAKSRGRGRFQFFTAEMQEAAARRVALEADLRAALELGQFELHYQPQIDLRSGGVSGVEALVRWRHPARGLVSPAEFIPLAEDTGLIDPLGDWILIEACRQLATWRDAGLTGVRMSVNLSARQFRDAGLPERIRAILEETGLPPGMLDLEITETLSMEAPTEVIPLMRRLTGQGLSLSIDDFGTGYSSLAYLKLFPIRTLKIDRSFVKDIETDPNDADICDVTVLLAHKLGLDVVAEGVETSGQLKYLLSIGCEKIQGYFISKPLPTAEAESFIRRHPRLTELGTIDLWDKN